MHNLLPFILSSAFLPILSSAQAPITTSILLFGAGDATGFDYVASVIASDPKGGGTLFVTCSPTPTTSSAVPAATNDSTDDATDDDDDTDCGLGPGLTITLGPAAPTSAYDVLLAEPPAFTLSAHCDVVTAASTAVCTQVAGGPEANDPGTSIWTASIVPAMTAGMEGEEDYNDVMVWPVTITAGQGKLGAAAAAVAAGSTGTASARPSSVVSVVSASSTGVAAGVSSSIRSASGTATSAVSAVSAVSSAAASATSVVPLTNGAAGVGEGRVGAVVLGGLAAVCGGMMVL